MVTSLLAARYQIASEYIHNQTEAGWQTLVSRVNANPLAALKALAEEFDRYDAAMTKIGRGHEDHGGQRKRARDILAQFHY